ncbi:hypothetical protein AAGG49_22305, partial [Stenotrophomonas maltophilia]|uniref:hypothetical protein n=1 Tax=Stenotrophomonas maltophilia TaxID=40324 RepID=UPI003143C2A4
VCFGLGRAGYVLCGLDLSVLVGMVWLLFGELCFGLAGFLLGGVFWVIFVGILLGFFGVCLFIL